ncbi:trans-sulfuration enzyme family protein [Profundibacter sp.]
MSNPPSQMNLSPSTRAAQAMHSMDQRTGAVVPGIELASTFARNSDYELRDGFIYGRYGNPTTRQAETVISSLDGSAASMLFGSGMSAFVALFETLDSGDHVVLPQVMYHGGLDWVRRLEAKRGLQVTLFDATDATGLQNTMRPDTKLVWIESPTNPNWEVIDISAAAQLAHEVGALLAVDCTVSPPVTMDTLALGADIAFQSATKYLNGHSDITGGVLSFAKEGPLLDEVQLLRQLQGSVMAGFEAWLLIRGMRTLYLRFERASTNALQIAEHFENHPMVDRVLYPGLAAHPGHDIAARQMTGGFGGMLSLLVKGDEVLARDVARFTQVFFPATSLGGVESLIEHRKTIEGPHSLVASNLLRLSVGIEDVRDLIADIEQALERAQP